MAEEKRVTVVSVNVADLAFLITGCTLLGRLCVGQVDIEKLKDECATDITGAMFSSRRVNQQIQELFNSGLLRKEDLEEASADHAEALKENINGFNKSGKL